MEITHFAPRYELDRYRLTVCSTPCEQHLSEPTVSYVTTNKIFILYTTHCRRMYAALKRRSYFYNCNRVYCVTIRMMAMKRGL